MAYRRCISTKTSVLSRRCNPYFTFILHDDDHKHQSLKESPSPQTMNRFFQGRSFGSFLTKFSGAGTSGHSTICSQRFLPSYIGSSLCRHMSTTVGEGSDKMGIVSDVAEAFRNNTAEVLTSHVPPVNEVAIAAADSFVPIAALQHFIDIVHSFTGLNWWAAIAVTTLVIRGATLPLLVNQLKSTSKLAIIKPQLEEITKEVKSKGMDPEAIAEGQKKTQKLFAEHGVSPLTPLKGMLIQGPIFCFFFLAISNMAEKVYSFKYGGGFWFLDLSTPDEYYVFPVISGLMFLITVECNALEGMEANPNARFMKNFMRVLAVLSVPLTANFPKAIFCYWLPSNLFSFMYGLVIKRPGVRKFLGVPDIPASSPPANPPEPVFPALKGRTTAQQLISSPSERLKPPEKRISPSEVSQNLRNLEKRVKGRKKNKKR